MQTGESYANSAAEAREAVKRVQKRFSASEEACMNESSKLMKRKSETRHTRQSKENTGAADME